MKKYRSPLKNQLNDLLGVTQRSGLIESKKNDKGSQILSKTHDMEHKRNANSIKKVLKELQQLKKELKDIKYMNKQDNTPQQLDNSKCRKLQAEARKSQSPYSRQSSRKKSQGRQKQTSAQTRPNEGKNVKQFSFTVQETQSKKHKHVQSSEEQDQNDYKHHYSGKKNKETKRYHEKDDHNIKRVKSSLLQQIQQNENHQKWVHLLKQNLQILPITTNIFDSEEKMKLNIQMERFCNQLKRIPTHMQKPTQYYEIISLYARSLNNQLNNLTTIINKCGRHPLQDRYRIDNRSHQKEATCHNCLQHQKKDYQKLHRRELKRLQKQLQKMQGQLFLSKQQINILTTQNLILLKEKQAFSLKDEGFQKRFLNQQQKVKLLNRQLADLQSVLHDLQASRARDSQKIRLLQQDISSYRSQLEKYKRNNILFNDHSTRDRPSDLEKQRSMINELKEKEILYQSIIRDKENMIAELKNKIQGLGQAKYMRDQINDQKSERSIDSREIYQLKIENQEKNRALTAQMLETQQWKSKAKQYMEKNSELQEYLQQYTTQINRLNNQVQILQSANQKFKDKYLKTKVKNEEKSKKQIESKTKKGQAFQQINQLINIHRKAIENP